MSTDAPHQIALQIKRVYRKELLDWAGSFVQLILGKTGTVIFQETEDPSSSSLEKNLGEAAMLAK